MQTEQQRRPNAVNSLPSLFINADLLGMNSSPAPQTGATDMAIAEHMQQPQQHLQLLAAQYPFLAAAAVFSQPPSTTISGQIMAKSKMNPIQTTNVNRIMTRFVENANNNCLNATLSSNSDDTKPKDIGSSINSMKSIVIAAANSKIQQTCTYEVSNKTQLNVNGL